MVNLTLPPSLRPSLLNTGSLFAMCPVKEGSVERCVDSSRYFVLKIQNASGRHAFVGVAFNEREEAFDFNVAMQEYEKDKARTERLRAGGKESEEEEGREGGAPKVDLSLKEGEKLTIRLPTREGGGGATAGGERKKRVTGSGGSVAGGGGLLPPPPGSSGGGLLPPPASVSSASAQTCVRKARTGAAAHDDFLLGSGFGVTATAGGKDVDAPASSPFSSSGSSFSSSSSTTSSTSATSKDDFGGFVAPVKPSPSPTPSFSDFPSSCFDTLPLEQGAARCSMSAAGTGSAKSSPLDSLGVLGAGLPGMTSGNSSSSSSSSSKGSDPFADLLPFK